MNISLALDVRVRATLLAGLLWAIPAGGQMQNGEIVGLVTDSRRCHIQCYGQDHESGNHQSQYCSPPISVVSYCGSAGWEAT